MAHRRLKAQNAGILERIFGIELRSIYEEEDSCWSRAVSYTHLDVYKRQFLSSHDAAGQDSVDCDTSESVVLLY